MKKTTLPIRGDLLPNLCTPKSIIGLILVGELLALTLVLYRSELPTFSWSYMGTVSIVIQWIVLCSAAALCSLRGIFRKISPAISGSLAYATVLLIAAIVLAIAQWVLTASPQFWDFLKHMFIAAIFTGVILRCLYLQQQLHNERRAELQSRIHALQARIRPHFLFNSMNTIASLIATDPDAAEKAVEDLSELFRASLQYADLVPLADELSLCRRYIDIEQLRLGDRLKVEWQCDELPKEIQIPGLSLQPLIENAIVHGIQKLGSGGVIKVTVNTDDVDLCIQVCNPFPDSVTSAGTEQGHEIAMTNINHRLQAHYGQSASLMVQVELGNSVNNYIVTMRLPL